MWMKIINLDDVNVIKNGKVVLREISTDIDRGSFVAIIGSNGSGKSTLINLLYGFDDFEGYVHIDGFFLEEDNLPSIRKNVSIVSGDNDCFVFGKVIDELVIPLENMGLDKDEINKRLDYIVSLFGLNNILYKSMNEITNSKKQVVLISQALISNADIILIDDCMHQMDAIDKSRVLKVLYRYKKEKKTTIVMATHDVDDVMMCDRVIVLDKGSILMDDSVISVFKRKDQLLKIGVGIPFVVDLSLRLLDKKIIKHVYLDMGKLVDDVWK